MKLERIFSAFGLMLLAGGFLFSAARLLTIKGVASPSDARKVLRFAHVTIHPGIIKAYDDAMREYERLHPDVRIEQVPVPLRLWASWLRTQMIGETAPDLVDMDRGQEDEFLARYLTPLDPWLRQPNPYNQGTDLDGIPWRDTFVDGITREPAYRPNLRRVYGIPLTLGTTRVFANARLLKEITGSTEAPSNYDEFIGLCRRIREYSERTGRPLDPLAGSNTHSLPLLNRLYSTQTQKSALAGLDVPNLAPNMRDGAVAYLRGRWTWRSPEVESGIKLMQEVGGNMAPGFVQLQRDDSLLHFTQQNAVMLASGSWEADTVFSQCSFPLVSFPIPLPLPTDERFGANVLGPISELAIPPGNAVGVSRGSRHTDLAVDFLRYLTSKPVSEKIMNSSRRLSCIVGVAPSEEMAVFQVREDGYPAGFPVEFSEGFNDAVRVYRTHLYALYGPQGSPDRFIAAMEEHFPKALKKDLANMVRDAARISRKEDGGLVKMSQEPATKSEDLSLLLESQTLRELDASQTLYLLANPGK